jgi:hypothetical protein
LVGLIGVVVLLLIAPVQRPVAVGRLIYTNQPVRLKEYKSPKIIDSEGFQESKSLKASGLA